MKNVLIVSGHPDLVNSFANKLILNELRHLLPQANFDFLDELYPDYKIDVVKEQERLIKADIIVLQFPFFWYGMPSILKKWMEDVFVHGFSHGSTGNKLHGKKIIMSFTAGAPEDMYQSGGIQGYSIDEFVAPMKQFAKLCGMEWQEYIFSGGLSYASRNDEVALVLMRKKAITHAERLVAQIKII